MLNHTELINYIIETKRLSKYLEIGSQGGVNFNAIKCMFKHSVDPDPKAVALYKMTSDEYFAQNKHLTHSLVFIDGMHTEKQVENDFVNAMAVLEPDGFIILHDTNPEKEEWTFVPRQTKQWTGTVYKFICRLQANFHTLPFDYGMTVVRKGHYWLNQSDVSWQQFCTHRNTYLRVTNLEKFKAWL